ncbi:MAG TPA: FtsW/RodA/SpoVE family cell cycle protein, partial [Candidatus Woesebacteria bacterium]|nr:FtsW/RodA/SpoVE family cell cycle protein [Candidatus Woesebacteria bacterium]
LQLIPAFLIFLFGLINIFGIRPDLTVRYIGFFIAGLIFFVVIKLLRINIQFIRSNATALYWIFIIILGITLYFGVDVNGSRRWFDIFLFRFQPSEFMKIFFIIFLSNMFAKYQAYKQRNTIFLLTLLYTIIPFFLIYRQPDLGTATVFLAIFMIMAFLSPIPKKHLSIFLGGIIAILPLLWFIMHDYQRDRIIGFLDPAHDVSDTTYNMTQAIISIGSGNLMGNGLGLGTQSQLYFLPEYHTDFAFSSFIEQFGFIGGFILIILYLIFFLFLFFRMMHYANHKDELGKFNYYYLVGFSAFLIFQTCVNIGMNLGLLPIAGITLPFISYGGSSLITLMIGLALLP